MRRVTGGIVAVVASVLVASCTGPDDSPVPSAGPPSRAETADPAAGRTAPPPSPDPAPRTGICRRLGPDDLRTIVNDDPRVRCRSRHTAVTFHVGRLPKRVTRGATTAGDAAIERAADRVCASRLRPYVGGDRTDRALSMLASTYFLPSSRQFALGARWVRCDLFAYATPTRVAELPGRMRRILDRDNVSAAFARCSPVSPSHQRFQHVTCDEPHRWRAVDTLVLGRPGERYPGRGTVQGRARERCEGRVRDYLGTDSGFSYGFEVPRRHAWSGGDRSGFCWARTSG
ncbi:MAG: septum formation family protein [Nocardioidaceae bacterium]